MADFNMFSEWRPQRPSAMEATEALLHDEKGRTEQPNLKPAKKTITITKLGGGLAFLAILSLAIGTTLLLWPRLQSPPQRWESCGNDTTTARARGCSFEILSFSWQTPECFDSDIVDQFLGWQDWKWYTDKSLTVEVPMEEVMLGERTTYVSFEYHAIHCTFASRQLHRAYENGFIDSHLRSDAHTRHCHAVLLSSLGKPFIPQKTEAEIVYPKCERVDTKEGSSYLSTHHYN